MAISIEQLEGYLLQEELQYAVLDDERIMLHFAMDHYLQPRTDERSLVVGVRVADEGRYAEICAPRLYDARLAVDVGRLAELLLHLGFIHHQGVRLGLDRGDGTVQATISFELGEGTVTRATFIRSLRWLPRFVDFWHPVVDRAIRTGVLPGVDRISGHPEIARMIALAGGVDGFLEIVSRKQGTDAATGPRAGAGEKARRGWRSLLASFFIA